MDAKLLATFLAALKTKFVGVPDAVLERIAKKKGETLTSEEGVNSAIEGISLQNIFEYYGDSRATEATQSAVLNYEKKHGIKDGKQIQPEEPIGGEHKQEVRFEGLPESVQKMFEAQGRQISDLTKLVQGAVSVVTTSKRETDAKQLISNAKLPEKWTSRIDFDSETPIEEQIKSLQEEYVEIRQSVVNEKVDTGDYIPGGKGKEMSESDWVKIMDGEPSDTTSPGVASLNVE